MARSAEAWRFFFVFMLVAGGGCVWSPVTNKPVSTSVISSEVKPASLPGTTVSQVSYQTPENTASPSPVPSEGLVELPETAAPSGEQLPTIQAPLGIGEPATVASPLTYVSNDPADPFCDRRELPLDQLVAEVQFRNPSLQAASSAWRAAAERYPQAVSLDDPMFTSMITPSRGFGMEDGGGWMVQGSQKVPWSGKRALRGSAATAEADAMKGDIGDTRLRLAEAARTAYYDYYLARRQMEVNTATRKLLQQFREIAGNRYQTGQATEQDVLDADVELASQESRWTELARDEQIAIARINTLLHREAGHPLPLPPGKVQLPDSLPNVEALQQAAAQCRPDLYAAYSRIRAEQANRALAEKEYYPDMNLVAKYDGLMPEEMRPQVGMDVNVPIRYGKRSAAVRESENRIAQRCAEYQDRLDRVRFEVQSGFQRASQSAQVVNLYEKKILPAAQRSLDSALANYTSGKLDFLRLLDAERQLNNQRDMYYQAIAEYHRRLAELERAVGKPLATAL